VEQDQRQRCAVLNRFDPDNVEFIRRFLNGATRVELDANGRLLIPKPLMAYASTGEGRRVHGHGRSHRDVERGTAQACAQRERGLQVTGGESDGREALKPMVHEYHDPVLLQACLEGLNIRPDGVYVDVTFGGGGHSKAILQRLGPKAD
jgi:hypothetical protein